MIVVKDIADNNHICKNSTNINKRLSKITNWLISELVSSIWIINTFAKKKLGAMMSNNDILKKLRIALQLRDDDIIEILRHADFKVTKTELSAFFRNEDHPNYKPLGDQILRKFLNGLIIFKRGPKLPPISKS